MTVVRGFDSRRLHNMRKINISAAVEEGKAAKLEHDKILKERELQARISEIHKQQALFDKWMPDARIWVEENLTKLITKHTASGVQGHLNLGSSGTCYTSSIAGSIPITYVIEAIKEIEGYWEDIRVFDRYVEGGHEPDFGYMDGYYTYSLWWKGQLPAETRRY